jgi:hypothetical protein
VDASRKRLTFLIANPAAVQAWRDTENPGVIITRLESFPERDSLFLVEEAPDGTELRRRDVRPRESSD